MPTIDPLFSILIPSLPSRISRLTPLFRKLEAQIEHPPMGENAITSVGPLPVEILVCMDNKTRSIGLKRQSLLDIARGRFVAFVDDDDRVSDSYVYDIVEAIRATAFAPEVDVIVFNQTSYLGDADPVEIRFGLEHPGNEEVKIPGPGVFYRKPWHVCAWRRELAQRCVFPDASYGEDWWWAAQCNQLARQQIRIDKVLHSYHWSPSVTEAELVYPPKEIPAPNPHPYSRW